ncbi:hypothetical protein TNIN_359691 [Trichonephila inaurata madagascariensis]|uniref:Uncharacterized protein n=1 Tax=Trichonephila inaurata madagascariensis TaxID=2747483 RepID=A0A8X6XJE0_9ARAC|nr:hypothetical protein TNIN_90511 [Trichonephila inaurata madagascariensis]GFY54276.1 hypothetical protein TNIN_359691 [Trichonephila inaurata madagascariensis]
MNYKNRKHQTEKKGEIRITNPLLQEEERVKGEYISPGESSLPKAKRCKSSIICILKVCIFHEMTPAENFDVIFGETPSLCKRLILGMLVYLLAIPVLQVYAYHAEFCSRFCFIQK